MHKNESVEKNSGSDGGKREACRSCRYQERVKQPLCKDTPRNWNRGSGQNRKKYVTGGGDNSENVTNRKKGSYFAGGGESEFRGVRNRGGGPKNRRGVRNRERKINRLKNRGTHRRSSEHTKRKNVGEGGGGTQSPTEIKKRGEQNDKKINEQRKRVG